MSCRSRSSSRNSNRRSSTNRNSRRRSRSNSRSSYGIALTQAEQLAYEQELKNNAVEQRLIDYYVQRILNYNYEELKPGVWRTEDPRMQQPGLRYIRLPSDFNARVLNALYQR